MRSSERQIEIVGDGDGDTQTYLNPVHSFESFDSIDGTIAIAVYNY